MTHPLQRETWTSVLIERTWIDTGPSSDHDDVGVRRGSSELFGRERSLQLNRGVILPLKGGTEGREGGEEES